MLALLLCCALAIGAFSSAALAAEETIVKSYDDLSYAIANGGNIKLGVDIEISSESASFGITNEVTLDLAGYALTRAGTSSAKLFDIGSGGKLTINDTGSAGSIESSYPVQLKSGAAFVLNGGSITSTKGAAVDIYTSAENVLVEINGGAVNAASSDNAIGVRGKANVVVNINGGKITTGSNNRLAMYISGDKDDSIQVNITSGEITSNGQTIQAYSGAEINVSGDAVISSATGTAISTQSGYGVVELNVTGGTIKTEGARAYAVYARESSDVNISGGAVSGGYGLRASDSADVAVSGGTVEGSISAISVSDSANVTVTGGAFNKDVSDYIDSSAAVAEFSAEGKKTYVVGDTIAEKAAEAAAGTEINVTKGSVALTDVSTDVKVKNTGDAEVTVNGVDVPDDGTVVSACDHALTDVAETAATCTSEGVKAHKKCSVCEKTFIDGAEVSAEELKIAMTAHTLTNVAETAATCTAEGVKAHQHCSVCEKNFIDGAEKTDDELKIAKAAHTLTNVAETPATCTAEGVKAHQHCTVCEKNFIDGAEKTDDELKIAKAAHTLTDVAETPATATTDGVKAHQHCTVCEKNFIDGVEKTDAELKIPATGDESSAPSESSEPDESSKPADSSETDSSEAGSSETSSSGTPSTGDAGSIALWVALFAVAGAAVVIVLRRRTA